MADERACLLPSAKFVSLVCFCPVVKFPKFGVYQNKCVNGIYKKLKNNLVAEPVGPVKNGFLFFTSP